ncbi:hypothetical protein ACIBBB_25135 [Streptomyces sp. NPDC051217]|uniref:hypothetical protein n=1 Tax=Streptomyces sp. NPDC051217 TaxID=3365644 RepID=UPI003798B82B
MQHGGVSFTWPSTAGSGTPGNVVAFGQTVGVDQAGRTLGFLLSGTFSGVAGTGALTTPTAPGRASP